MAMSVLAGMGQQQRAESGPSHIIIAAQSQSAARWWAAPPLSQMWLITQRKKRLATHNLQAQISHPHLVTCFYSSYGAMMLWPGAQQQPSGNGLRLLRASCSLCHKLQGLDSNISPFGLPAHHSSPDCNELRQISRRDELFMWRHTALFQTHNCYINILDQMDKTHKAVNTLLSAGSSALTLKATLTPTHETFHILVIIIVCPIWFLFH